MYTATVLRYWYPSCKKTNIWTDTNLLEVYRMQHLGSVMWSRKYLFPLRLQFSERVWLCQL
jgi:hypothetical protein